MKKESTMAIALPNFTDLVVALTAALTGIDAHVSKFRFDILAHEAREVLERFCVASHPEAIPNGWRITGDGQSLSGPVEEYNAMDDITQAYAHDCDDTKAALRAAAGTPLTRDLASRWRYAPERLTALPENPQVHYERGGADYARAVADLLPAAAARVESIHGRRFARPAAIGAYVSPGTFGAATGFGKSQPVPVAGTFFNNVMLSPALFTAQRQRLPLMLPHELSHAHLQSWMSQLAYARLPNWFQEGLGVMVAEGGGAESVSEVEARQAIRRGDRIVIGGASFELDSPITFEKPPEVPDTLPASGWPTGRPDFSWRSCMTATQPDSPA
jgi:hypothetical protein